MKALILCAGKGTRLGKLTKDTPKVMLKIGGKPVLEHLVDHLNSFGITEIIVNLHHKPEKIYKYFGTRLLYFYEPKLLGEEETERRLKEWLGDKYIVMNGDTLTDIDIDKTLGYAERENTEVHSVERDGLVDIYTGFAIKGDYSTITRYVSNCYWQDIGTPEGLKKARKHYAKRISSLPKL